MVEISSDKHLTHMRSRKNKNALGLQIVGGLRIYIGRTETWYEDMTTFVVLQRLTDVCHKRYATRVA